MNLDSICKEIQYKRVIHIDFNVINLDQSLYILLYIYIYFTHRIIYTYS